MREGKKYDNGKLRYDLLPPLSIEKVVEILTFGAEKYGPNNWKNVKDGRARYTAALMRHLEAYRKGELLDSESGNYHLAHLLCCAIFLLEIEIKSFNKKQKKIRKNNVLFSKIRRFHS